MPTVDSLTCRGAAGSLAGAVWIRKGSAAGGEGLRDAAFVRAYRFAGAARRVDPAIDLGSEPALAAGGPVIGRPPRRAVSGRWLSGTVLTGVTSLVLMGGALMAALNGQVLLAAAPQSADLALFGAAIGGQKGDRIIPEPPRASTREVVRVGWNTRRDDRDVIQQRPFVRINAALATARGDGIVVPPYDPLAVIGTAANPDTPIAEAAIGGQFYGANVDGEIAVRTAPFPLAAAFAAGGPPVTIAEIEAVVRGAAPALVGGGAARTAALAFATPVEIDLAAATARDGPGGLGVRIIPQNVSFVTKSDTTTGGPSRDERILAMEPGRPLSDLLIDTGMSEIDARDVVAAMEGLIDLSRLTVDHRLRVAFTPSTVAEATPRPLRVSIYAEGIHQATVARNDQGAFVRADEPPALTDGLVADAPAPIAGQMPRLYEAIYLTALAQQIPAPLINQLVRIFAFELDMQSRIGPSDSLEVFHTLPTTDGAADEGILYAAVTLAGVTKRYYRFQTSDDGAVDYYDAEGRSANNFLLRKPISVGEYRSGYGMRIHPILRTRAMHTGVDWAAPQGTPIMAAGDGVVVSAGRHSSYGRYTRIQHANGYETAYAHQTRIAPGIVPGAVVHQGQIIGYVGSTGLSTGTHLHYEVRINGQTVDPLRIRLPRGRVLDGDILTAFLAQRAQLDTLLGITDTTDPTQLAAAR